MVEITEPNFDAWAGMLLEEYPNAIATALHQAYMQGIAIGRRLEREGVKPEHLSQLYCTWEE